MDRLSMPSAMPAEVAERMSDRGSEIPKWALDRAREDLTDKLRDGKKVGGCDLWDLLDCETNTDRYRFLLEELGGLLLSTADSSLRCGEADKIRDGIIERFLSGGIGEEAVNERAEEIISEPEEA